MSHLPEIEELFKNEELAKNRAMVQALLRNAALLHDKGVSDADRAKALENIKVITQGKQPKIKKPVAAPDAMAPAVAAAPVGEMAAPGAKPAAIPFHEEFAQHHGGDPIQLKNTFAAMSPGQMKMAQDFHAEHLKSKMTKSLETLSDLFIRLKETL